MPLAREQPRSSHQGSTALEHPSSVAWPWKLSSKPPVGRCSCDSAAGREPKKGRGAIQKRPPISFDFSTSFFICWACKPKTKPDPGVAFSTNLLDVPAEIIALMYSYRWAVEIFFRFYKQLMGGAHLISQSDNGIKLQVYCSMIVCLLINLWNGEKPNKRTFEMISYYFEGLASEAELLAHIEKQKRAAETKRIKAEGSKNVG